MTIMMMMMTKLMLMLKMLKMTMIMFESFVFFKDYNLHTLCNATLILDGHEALMLRKNCSNLYETHICLFLLF